MHIDGDGDCSSCPLDIIIEDVLEVTSKPLRIGH
jgi:hypothetical protein